ncbi:hypothetical protein, partial [Nioella sediminis]|uniref:hypothetical protein n=1 Tax=Nioella sediminis TaxID=1912092 RepID=UPI001B80C5AD
RFHMKNFRENSSLLIEKSSGRFFSANDTDVSAVADDQELTSCLDQVKSAFADLKFQPVPTDLAIHIRFAASDHAAFGNGFCREDLVKPNIVAVNGAKIAHAAIFAPLRLTGD